MTLSRRSWQPLKELLQDVLDRPYALAAFNVYDFWVTRAVVRAASDLGVPVIVACGGSDLDIVGPEAVASWVASERSKAPVPVYLHLDHGRDLAEVIRCIAAGFDSVMFDGSQLPFEKNVQKTREVVYAARSTGAVVEGAVGRIPSKGQGEPGVAITSEDRVSVEMVSLFVQETGVDLVAVPVGSAHGAYAAGTRTHLDLDLVRALSQQVRVPLALHGGSGVDESDIRAAIGMALGKVNFGSVLRAAHTGAIREFCHASPARDPAELGRMTVESVYESARAKLSLLFEAVGQGR
ncbi:MAG: class II fructose-bisphosphate aldolase [Limnochordaceae bacterium]|nr:class II fructose-bisphosphate aldolase [Limnochordaceae bacterium]